MTAQIGSSNATQDTTGEGRWSERWPVRGGGATLRVVRESASSARRPALDAERERAVLEEIRELEIERWRVLLDYRPALAVVDSLLRDRAVGVDDPEGLAREARRARELLRRVLAERTAPARGRLAGGALEQAARALFALDSDRILIKRAHASVTAARTDRAPVPPAQLAAIRRAARESEAVRHAFLGRNQGLVLSIARRYWRGQIALGDLVQEGNIGLIKALNRFDVSRGNKFSTYAAWWIRHYVRRARTAAGGGIVRLPQHLSTALQRVRATEARVTAAHGRPPQEREVLRDTGISERQLDVVRRYAIKAVVSLDQESQRDGDGRRGIQLADDSQASPFDATLLSRFTRNVDDLLDTLPPKERAILVARFGLEDRGDGATLKEIGAAFGLSRERIRQIQGVALDKLRRALEGEPAAADLANA